MKSSGYKKSLDELIPRKRTNLYVSSEPQSSPGETAGSGSGSSRRKSGKKKKKKIQEIHPWGEAR